jgi:hypothetical protein
VKRAALFALLISHASMAHAHAISGIIVLVIPLFVMMIVMLIRAAIIETEHRAMLVAFTLLVAFAAWPLATLAFVSLAVEAGMGYEMLECSSVFMLLVLFGVSWNLQTRVAKAERQIDE